MSTLGIIVLIIVSILIGFFINSVLYHARLGAKLEEPAPGFYAELLDGSKIGFMEWDRPPQSLLLCFVSPSCVVCRRLSPFLNELVETYPNTEMDVIIIGINGEKNEFKKWKESLNLNVRVAVDVDGISKMRYAVYSLPAVFQISSVGLIKMIHTGFRPGDDVKFENLFKERAEHFKQLQHLS
ncbi:MAG: redoxin domain-containing protein [Candidatus Marinimicrobia bacterium]|nr:redoxin domain-containing protein [Candidatus Neomarinimicrobiota bacterium]